MTSLDTNDTLFQQDTYTTMQNRSVKIPLLGPFHVEASHRRYTSSSCIVNDRGPHTYMQRSFAFHCRRLRRVRDTPLAQTWNEVTKRFGSFLAHLYVHPQKSRGVSYNFFSTNDLAKNNSILSDKSKVNFFSAYWRDLIRGVSPPLHLMSMTYKYLGSSYVYTLTFSTPFQTPT